MQVNGDIVKFQDEMTGWRRDLHANPETAFEEFWTSDYIAKLLDDWGVEYERGFAGTGIVATIRGAKGEGRTIALRADMDALNILEQTNVAYCSKNEGKMHACGHDGHSAMLLGATKYLSENNDFSGTAHLIFQPAEEAEGGARVMVEEGFFDKFPCDLIFGMHNWPGLPEGTMSICEGPITAAADRFKMKITGKGGHAAMPHKNIDVITAASTVVTTLQSLVSRNTDPMDGAVVSVCKFHAGTESLNVMPESVDLGGTVRTFRPETRRMIEDGMKRIVDTVATAYGARAEVEYSRGYPSCINSAEGTKYAGEAAVKTVGADRFDPNFTPTAGAEDFAYFLEKCSGAYIILGAGRMEDGTDPSLHSPHFDFNDDVLPVGATYWVNLVKTILG